MVTNEVLKADRGLSCFCDAEDSRCAGRMASRLRLLRSWPECLSAQVSRTIALALKKHSRDVSWAKKIFIKSGGSAGDPLGIQGGSSAKTGDPGSMQCLKRGIGWGSGARTETLYNIKLAE